MKTKISQIKISDIGKKFELGGWVRTVRDQGNFAFVAINDGSCFSNLQIIINADKVSNYQDILKKISTGASLVANGELIKSLGKEQPFELEALSVDVLGTCDPENYPLQKKRHSFEFLRTIAHLRGRTNTFGAVARVRNALSFATHKFFNERGFLYLHTPIITGSDCEGAGQMFRVTTLDVNNPPRTKDGHVDNAQDFFGHPTYLTVSGQLNGETYACGLSSIYTFGPTFRAENSNTSRHLAEFWMIEPEVAFADITDNMNLAEDYLKYVIKYALENCPQDMEFFDKFISNGVLERMQLVVNSSFERVPYTTAVDILLKSGKKFEFPVSWGCDLQSEHERYLTEQHFKKPIILINYPKQIKSFYMKQNEDGKTVAAMDVLVPGIGEIIGGSQREDDLEKIEKRIKELGMNPADYWWYLELRKYGSVPHAGFGLGLERLVLFVTGMENIRDVIPFPRYPNHAEF